MWCYIFKHFVGQRLDRGLFNYLGEFKGRSAQILIYVGMFFSMKSYLGQQKHIDINHVVNIREKPGEIMVGIIMQSFPHKVDQRRMREILQQKSQYNLMHLNRLHNVVHGGDGQSQHQAPIKLVEQEESIEKMLDQYGKGKAQQPGPSAAASAHPPQAWSSQSAPAPQSGTDPHFEEKLLKLNAL